MYHPLLSLLSSENGDPVEITIVYDPIKSHAVKPMFGGGGNGGGGGVVVAASSNDIGCTINTNLLNTSSRKHVDRWDSLNQMEQNTILPPGRRDSIPRCCDDESRAAMATATAIAIATTTATATATETTSGVVCTDKSSSTSDHVDDDIPALKSIVQPKRRKPRCLRQIGTTYVSNESNNCSENQNNNDIDVSSSCGGKVDSTLRSRSRNRRPRSSSNDHCFSYSTTRCTNSSSKNKDTNESDDQRKKYRQRSRSLDTVDEIIGRGGGRDGVGRGGRKKVHTNCIGSVMAVCDDCCDDRVLLLSSALRIMDEMDDQQQQEQVPITIDRWKDRPLTRSSSTRSTNVNPTKANHDTASDYVPRIPCRIFSPLKNTKDRTKVVSFTAADFNQGSSSSTVVIENRRTQLAFLKQDSVSMLRSKIMLT